MAVKYVKNGKIEFLRFAFCVVVLLYHIAEKTIGLDYKILGEATFFGNGYFCVEFFFIVSGYLMASSAFKNCNSNVGLGKETFGFMYKKLMAVLPYHILVFAITYAAICIGSRLSLSESIFKLFDNIPNILLIQKSGLPNTAVLGVEWYISDMLTAMVLLYPLCRKNYDKFTKIIAPVVALTVIGYLIKTTGRIAGIGEWTGLFSKTLLRAVAELCAGVFIFELCRNLKKLNFTKVDKAVMTAIEIACYGIVMAFIVLDIPRKYEGHTFIVLCVGVLLSFSEVTYGVSLFKNRFVYFLGSLSLPLYLCQSLARRIAVSVFEDQTFAVKVVVFLGITFIMTFALMPIEKQLRKLINRKTDSLGLLK